MTTIVIIATMYITGQLTRQSSIPVSEKIFINSYANAAVATFESGREKAFSAWLRHIELSKHLTMYLLSSTGSIHGTTHVPKPVKQLSKEFLANQLPTGIFQRSNYIVSHEILTLSQKTYRVVTYLHTPISHLTQIPWADVTLVTLIVIVLSGTICYFLSLYLTMPIRNLRQAAKAIAEGKLKTRVDTHYKQRHDEIAELGQDFDTMAEHIEHLILAKERLLQDISHELRSPLARLQLAVAIAKKTHEAKSFDRMELEIHRLDELIGDILTLAKMQTTKIIINKKNISIDKIIQLIVDDANFEFPNAKACFKTPDNNIVIKADEKLIHHAIENIVRNALKYTEADTTVSIYLIDKGDSLQIDIIDQGPGVPESYLSKIFDAFYRVDTARSQTTGGYGLGLAIARKAIGIHGGSIRAKNQSPHGLKVTVLLPK